MSEGIFLADKPVGPTSHDVVDRVRRALGVKRVGHAGTLDPFASGLLVLCVGWATRLAEYLIGLDKSYLARARLGVTTATDDSEGEPGLENPGWKALDRERVEEALGRFCGTYAQRPPDFSAKKVQGRTAYRLSREGAPPILQPVPVTIYELAIEAFEPPWITFRVTCSTGTYVRALARDLGVELGVGAHLVALRRERIGRFEVEDAVSADGLTRESLEAARVPPSVALSHLAQVELTAAEAGHLRQGRRVELSGSLPPGPVVAFHDDRVVAVGEGVDRILQPRKVFP